MLSKPDNMGGNNTMIILALRRAAEKYLQLFDSRKDEAIKEHKVAQQVLYKIKGKGQWTSAKNLWRGNAPTFNGGEKE